MTVRENPDLDDAFLGTSGPDVNRPAKGQKRRKRAAGLTRDQVRGYAFRALALLAGLAAPERERVLRLAMKVNRA
jgi:hypothetical protein